MSPTSELPLRPKATPPSTVGRGRTVRETKAPAQSRWSDDLIEVAAADSLSQYERWASPTVIMSDGGYGVLGFEGDTAGHSSLPEWYEPHIKAWSRHALPATTLWFWNSEIGWAAVHPVLERNGWRYVNANIWNKGKAHIAGNVNTGRIRRFPVVSELCVQYVREATVGGVALKAWLLAEWRRTGLPLSKANEACGVADAAVRKYLDQGHLWYCPPPSAFEKLQAFANARGNSAGRPYFALDGRTPASGEDWARLRPKFRCPHGFTNVWDRAPLHGPERFKTSGGSGKAIHLNQKPLDLVSMIIEAASDPGDIVWEPFGGLFTACVAARKLGRRAFGAEIDPTYFHYGLRRIIESASQPLLL